jgi:sigma-70-like protein
LDEAAQRPTNRIDVSVPAEARVIEGRPPLAPERERALLEAYMPRIAAMARHYRISPNVERVEVLQEGVETAQRLGVSTERVRKIARRARAKLAAAARDDAWKSTRRV